MRFLQGVPGTDCRTLLFRCGTAADSKGDRAVPPRYLLLSRPQGTAVPIRTLTAGFTAQEAAMSRRFMPVLFATAAALSSTASAFADYYIVREARPARATSSTASRRTARRSSAPTATTPTVPSPRRKCRCYASRNDASDATAAASALNRQLDHAHRRIHGIGRHIEAQLATHRQHGGIFAQDLAFDDVDALGAGILD